MEDGPGGRLPERRRLEQMAEETLAGIRRTCARAERLLHCLRRTGGTARRDRVSRSDDESGWRLAA